MYIKLLYIYVHMYVKKCTSAMLYLFTECVKLRRNSNRIVVTTTNATTNSIVTTVSTSIAAAATTTTNTTSKITTPAVTRSAQSKYVCTYVHMYLAMATYMYVHDTFCNTIICKRQDNKGYSRNEITLEMVTTLSRN